MKIKQLKFQGTPSGNVLSSYSIINDLKIYTKSNTMIKINGTEIIVGTTGIYSFPYELKNPELEFITTFSDVITVTFSYGDENEENI